MKWIIFCLVILFSSCNGKFDFFDNNFSLKSSKAIEKSEKIIKEESTNIPDFKTKTIEDIIIMEENQEVKNLKWMTSSANSVGSPYAKKGGAFYTYLHDIPNTFRYVGPQVDNVSKTLFNNHIPLLVKSLEDFQFLPGVATHWAFGEDGKTVYYKLNKNAMWSDGMPCTADDFIFAVDFMQNEYVARLSDSEDFINLSIRKINNEYIAITYNAMFPKSKELLLDFTNICPRAKHFYKEGISKNWIEKYNRKAEPTTAAYYLHHWDFNYGLSFKRVDTWWADSYKHFANMFNFDFIEIKILPGTQTSVRKYFRNKELDCLLISSEDEYLDATNDVRFKRGLQDIWVSHYQSIQGLNGIFFNTKTFPFDNIDFRRAMEYVLDIDGVLENVLQRGYSRCYTMGISQSCDGIPFNNQNIRLASYDKKKADELLQKAGFTVLDSSGIRMTKDGKKASFTILYDDIALKDVFGFLFAKAIECGVSIDFQFVSGGILKKINNKTFQAWWTRLPSSKMPNHYNLLHSTNEVFPYLSNVFGFSNKDLDALLEEYQNPSLSIQEKANCNIKIEEIVRENALFIPTYYPISERVICWKYIRFPGWLNLKYMKEFYSPFMGLGWFDEEIKNNVDEAMKNGEGFEERIWNLSSRYKEKDQ
ncbi:MAG: ABC transporter substrate-binding protein [Treponema sp.]